MAWPKSTSTQWQPGQSGNPSGRPVESNEFKEKCRAFMDEAGWKRLQATAKGKGRHCFEALELIAAYGLGRPIAKQELSGRDGGPIAYVDMSRFTDAELAGLVDLGKRARALIEAEKSGKS